MIRRRSARPGPETLLERRYRRLLACYPSAYRAANAEEMLAVALAGAAPGRRWPSPGESFNLVVSGARVRLRPLLGGLGADAWQGAAALVALIGPVLLATIYAESLTGSVASGLLGFPGRPPVSAMLLTPGWVLVAVAAWLRWRWAAAIGGLLGAAGEAVHLAVVYASSPPSLVAWWWQLVLALTTALAAVMLVIRPVGGPRPLGGRVMATVLAAAAALTAFPVAEAASTTVTSYPDGAAVLTSPLFGIDGLLRMGLFAVLAAAVLSAVVRTGPAARRRVVVLVAPVAVVAAVVEWAFGGFLTSEGSAGLAALQWAALVLVPILAFAAGLAGVGSYERMLDRVRREGITTT